MKGIGGNITGTIQKQSTTKNAIGEQVKSWNTVQTIKGWLDLVSGATSFTTFNAKIQESTHVFISDFVRLDPSIHAENCRMVVNGHVYDITLIDNPMELNEQLEFYLKYTGGVSSGS